MYLLKIVINFLTDKQYRGLTIATVIVLINGTLVYHFVEKFSWLDSLYFSVITLTTVGYGDLSPITPFGKVFTIIYIITGIGIILGFVDAFSKHRVKLVEERRKKNRRNS